MMQYTNETKISIDRISEGKHVFDIEIDALKKTRDILDDVFVQILNLITMCDGKIIITGIGKPGHIGAKLAATFSSLGTPSFYLHPGEAMHGDLGMISENDIVIAISYSGESDEIITILPNIKMIGATLVGITGNKESTLAKNADIVQILPAFEEACHLGLAPTSSTTAALCYGDALAVVASAIYGFKDVDFGKFHPAGALGKKLITRVDDLMLTGDANATIPSESRITETIVQLSKKGLGIVSVVDTSGRLIGVVTDGDLRRALEKGLDIYNLDVQMIMTHTPKVVQSGKLAVDAYNLMKEFHVSCLPVLKGDTVIGTIRLHDIISFGIVG